MLQQIEQHELARVQAESLIAECGVDGDAARERMGVEEAFDQIEGAAIIPVKLVAPMAGLLKQKRLKLTNGRLAQIDDVHWEGLTTGPWLIVMIADSREGPRNSRSRTI